MVTSESRRGDAEREFDRAMRNIYLRANKEVNYNATYLLHMLAEHGAHETARRLITTTTPSQGFTVLVQSRFSHLFTAEEVDAAALRLEEYGYRPPVEGMH